MAYFYSRNILTIKTSDQKFTQERKTISKLSCNIYLCKSKICKAYVLTNHKK